MIIDQQLYSFSISTMRNMLYLILDNAVLEFGSAALQKEHQQQQCSASLHPVLDYLQIDSSLWGKQ